jgi:transcriptional regulator with XRE-family HTH domain
MEKTTIDSAMKKAQDVFEQSGKTLDQLGEAMGYEGDVARKSAWQFLNKTADPRLSMLRRFAKAMGVTLEELVSDRPEKGAKK